MFSDVVEFGQALMARVLNGSRLVLKWAGERRKEMKGKEGTNPHTKDTEQKANTSDC